MDRGLDKWIAENVMEWQKVGYGAIGHGHGIHEPAKYGWYDKTGGMAHPDVKIWHPSESILDAFQVVEKMMEKFPDWFCTIDIFSQNYNKEDKGKGHCVVTFQESAEGYTIYSCEQAETIPLAICLAAKKAFKEVE